MPTQASWRRWASRCAGAVHATRAARSLLAAEPYTGVPGQTTGPAEARSRLEAVIAETTHPYRLRVNQPGGLGDWDGMGRMAASCPGGGTPPVPVADVRTASGATVETAAWQELYRDRYDATVRLAGLLVGDFRLGEEIAQDAFARLFESLADVKDPAAYLRGTVVNLCRRRIRHAVVVRRWWSAASTGRPVAEADPGEHLAQRSAVQAALRRLPARQREAVVLRYYAGLSDAETAGVMGLSAGTVKTHLHRAMASLARDVEELR